jgi:Family of unknown function (DUF6174)
MQESLTESIIIKDYNISKYILKKQRIRRSEMKKYLLKIVFLGLIVSCSENATEDKIVTASIAEDYSSITDPYTRWQAYKLQDYVIDEGISCNCPDLGLVKGIIMNNEVYDVEYDVASDVFPDKSKQEIDEQMMHFVMTVDEAFEFINSFSDAQIVDVEYDARFGFPSRMYVDVDSFAVDVEFSRIFTT